MEMKRAVRGTESGKWVTCLTTLLLLHFPLHRALLLGYFGTLNTVYLRLIISSLFGVFPFFDIALIFHLFTKTIDACGRNFQLALKSVRNKKAPKSSYLR